MSARQKAAKKSSSEENSGTKKASVERLTIASMLLNCRNPELSPLCLQIGPIVRHSGAGRTVNILNKARQEHG